MINFYYHYSILDPDPFSDPNPSTYDMFFKNTTYISIGSFWHHTNPPYSNNMYTVAGVIKTSIEHCRQGKEKV